MGRSVSVEMIRQRQGGAVTTHLLPLGSQGYWGTAGGKAFSLMSNRSEVRFLGATPPAWVRWVPMQESLTQEEWEKSLEQEIADADPARAPMLRERYAEMPRPQWSPLYDRAVGAETGSVWLREASSSQWIVVDRDGRLRTVSLPDRFIPYLILENRVLGVWRNDLDVEFVRAYRPPG